jgi:hypothetical protein
MVQNANRPENIAVNLDFKINGSSFYTHVDIKILINFATLEAEGKDVSRFPSLDKVVANIGQDIPSQKSRFCGLLGGPVNLENVLHIVDFENISATQIQSMQDYILINPENRSSSLDRIEFLNIKDI